MKDKIESFFNSTYKAISLNTIMKLFVDKKNPKEKILGILYDLEYKGKIMKDEYDNYIKFQKQNVYKYGIVKLSNKNNLYLDLPKGIDVFFHQEDLNKLKPGDAVFVELEKKLDNRNKYLCKIIRIVKRQENNEDKYFTKTIIKKTGNQGYYIEDNSKKYYVDLRNLNGAFEGDEVSIFIEKKDNNYEVKVENIIKRKTYEHVLSLKDTNGVKEFYSYKTPSIPINVDIDYSKYEPNSKIFVYIDEKNNAKFIKDLEMKDDLTSLIEINAYENQIPNVFSEEVLKECKNLNEEIDFTGRIDLRNLRTFTIDGGDAKDLDDAISIEKIDGGYYLYVSIADVSHYVKMDSEIFNEACKRGTSIYPIEHVIPMLPEKLSNELCSLNPHVDKLTKTCQIRINDDGEILDYRIYKSVINSDCRMTYTKVNEILLGNYTDPTYFPYINTLLDMNILSLKLEKRKLRRGYISFETREDELIIGENAKVEGIISDNHGQAGKIIENFMLVANECIADNAINLEVPFVFRNHEAPTVEAMQKLKTKLLDKKIRIHNIKNYNNPRSIQNVLDTILKDKTEDERKVICELFLRSMQQAVYSNMCTGHYGLALNQYATFTSPIRRLPDLLNHMMLDILLERRFDEFNKYNSLYEKLSNVSTETQKRAQEFERNIFSIMKYRYISELFGSVLKAKILFVQSDRIYIKTSENIFGYINYDKNLIRNSGIKIGEELYNANDEIEVMLKCINDINDQIEFQIINKNKVKKIG